MATCKCKLFIIINIGFVERSTEAELHSEFTLKYKNVMCNKNI